MITQYRLDPRNSRFSVQAFSTGMLSFLGHDPVFDVRDFQGRVLFPDDMIARMQLELIVHARSLAASRNVNGPERSDMEKRMWSEVLETETYPDITFLARTAIAERVESGRYHVGLEGQLTLRGRTCSRRIEAELAMFSNGVGLRGRTTVRMSEHGIPPVAVLGGSIRLKDEVILSFDLFGIPQNVAEPEEAAALRE
jgi:polyisoprenoid-binding protein YceI